MICLQSSFFNVDLACVAVQAQSVCLPFTMSCDKCGALKKHWRAAAHADEATGEAVSVGPMTGQLSEEQIAGHNISLPSCSEKKVLQPQSKIAAAPRKHTYVRVKVESLAILLQQAVSSGLFNNMDYSLYLPTYL